MTAQLKCAMQGATLVMTLCNPEHRNALGPEIYAAGIEALNVADGNPEVRSVVITGEGSCFSAGGNLQRLQANRAAAPEVQAASIESLHTWIECISSFPKPVLAAVEGFAAGAGFSLVLACDFVVAAHDAKFVMAYTNVGLSPDGGASWQLTRLVPRQLAVALLMSGDSVSATRLESLGVVHTVSTPGQALRDALALAERLNHKAPNVLRTIKELVAQAPQQGLSAHLAAERNQFVANLQHANAGIGIAAFLAKRSPDYR
jgi:enoyl-CoA hydratase/carnithine racemase